jgi:hypothetical protein
MIVTGRWAKSKGGTAGSPVGEEDLKLSKESSRSPQVMSSPTEPFDSDTAIGDPDLLIGGIEEESTSASD